MKDKKILLHICCAVCATSVIERLKEEGWQVEGFFYNPNIHPREEYEKRLENIRFLLAKLNIPLTEGEYGKERWFKKIKGFEEEKEGGRRCNICFEMRLKEALKESKRRNIKYFATTLTVSPHKRSEIINKIGKTLDKDAFVVRDFKKQGGFKRAMELSKKHKLYHQNYCGCIFSM